MAGKKPGGGKHQQGKSGGRQGGRHARAGAKLGGDAEDRDEAAARIEVVGERYPEAAMGDLRSQLAAMTSSDVKLNIVEIRKPEIDAKLVAQGIADQLIRRVAFRRAMKRAVQSALRLGAEGIKITCSGRLGGAEIARVEWYREGRVPLHTLRANIDYAEAEALTAYGIIGIKCWIFKGEILGHDPMAQDRLMMEAQTSGVRPAREDRRN